MTLLSALLLLFVLCVLAVVFREAALYYRWLLHLRRMRTVLRVNVKQTVKTIS
jgi:hypothetical protein